MELKENSFKAVGFHFQQAKVNYNKYACQTTNEKLNQATQPEGFTNNIFVLREVLGRSFLHVFA